MHQLNAGVEISATRERIWHALTDVSAVQSWLSLQAAVNLEAGLYTAWGPNIIGVPERGAISLRESRGTDGLDLSWEYRDVLTSVHITLRTGGESCFVMVEHVDLPLRPYEEDAAMHDFWYVALENLRSFVLTGHKPALPDYTTCCGDELKLQISVNADKQAVFFFISDPDQINRYFGRNAVVEPRVGGRFSYGWELGGPVEILAIDPPNRLSYSWDYEGEPSTVVTWSLEGSGGSTTITLSHSGFGDEARQDAYRAGWSSFLAIIRSMAELGEQWSMVRIEGADHGEV